MNHANVQRGAAIPVGERVNGGHSMRQGGNRRAAFFRVVTRMRRHAAKGEVVARHTFSRFDQGTVGARRFTHQHAAGAFSQFANPFVGVDRAGLFVRVHCHGNHQAILIRRVQPAHRPEDVQQSTFHVGDAWAVQASIVFTQRTFGYGTGGKDGIEVAHQQNVKLLCVRLIADEEAGADVITQINLLGVPAFALPQRLHDACDGGDACDGLGAAVYVHQGFEFFNIVVKIHGYVLFRE